MTTVPITAVRQALDDTEAALARLRPALADAYGNAGENLTRAAGQLDVAERARDAAVRRAEEAEQALAAAERRIGILNAVDAGRAHGAQRIMDERDQAQRDAKEAKERARVAHVAAYRLQQRTPDAAQRTLDRIRNARTGVGAWAELGMYFGMTPEQAGRRARDWRSTAERAAEQRAETASVLGARHMGDSERFHAAWHSARLRAQREASHSRVCRISRDAWRRRAMEAMSANSRVRALFDTHLGPLATAAVRRALDTLEG